MLVYGLYVCNANKNKRIRIQVLREDKLMYLQLHKHSELIVSHWRPMATYLCMNIGLGNGLLPSHYQH